MTLYVKKSDRPYLVDYFVLVNGSRLDHTTILSKDIVSLLFEIILNIPVKP